MCGFQIAATSAQGVIYAVQIPSLLLLRLIEFETASRSFWSQLEPSLLGGYTADAAALEIRLEERCQD
jgi:hypothetical protein